PIRTEGGPPMTRTRIGVAVATALLGGAGLLGLAACGPAGTTASVADGLSPEGQALAAMGYDRADLQAAPAQDPGPAPSASADAQGKAKPRKRAALARVMLHRNTLHGEATV